MRLPGRKEFAHRLSDYNCARCGDSFTIETSEDLLLLRTHRLLHLAAEWVSSFKPTIYWVMEEDGPRAVGD